MTTTDADQLILRMPNIGDATSMWRLTNESGVLDCNSSYLYLLLCRDFAETCIVAEQSTAGQSTAGQSTAGQSTAEQGAAEQGGKVVGFVSGYRPPADPNVLFIWQVGVCASVRRQGLGLRMLRELLDRVGDARPVRFLETTVSPSNVPSRRLFESLASQRGATLTQHDGFTRDDFPGGDHESEPLIRIGPFGGVADQHSRIETPTTLAKET